MSNLGHHAIVIGGSMAGLMGAGEERPAFDPMLPARLLDLLEDGLAGDDGAGIGGERFDEGFGALACHAGERVEREVARHIHLFLASTAVSRTW